MNMNEKAIATMNNEVDVVSVINNGVKPYISFVPESTEDQVKLYNAMNSPMYRIKAAINKPIKMMDAVLVPCTLVNEDTGEATQAIRAIIIDDKGDTYAATATGVITSLKNIMSVFGSLHFEKGLTVIPKEIPVKRGNTLTLEIQK